MMKGRRTISTSYLELFGYCCHIHCIYCTESPIRNQWIEITPAVQPGDFFIVIPHFFIALKSCTDVHTRSALTYQQATLIKLNETHLHHKSTTTARDWKQIIGWALLTVSGQFAMTAWLTEDPISPHHPLRVPRKYSIRFMIINILQLCQTAPSLSQGFIGQLLGNSCESPLWERLALIVSTKSSAVLTVNFFGLWVFNIQASKCVGTGGTGNDPKVTEILY